MLKVCSRGHITGTKLCHCGANAMPSFYAPGSHYSRKDFQHVLARARRLDVNAVRVGKIQPRRKGYRRAA